MATVTYGDHEPFEIDDNRADLIAYYRGEGASVDVAGEDGAVDVPVVEQVEVTKPGKAEAPVADADPGELDSH